MRTVPVLLLAYNRPQKLRALIESLRESRPEIVFVHLDGPKAKNILDAQKIQECFLETKSIDWTDQVFVELKELNVGLKRAVIDSVSKVLESHDAIIVLEEDVIVGPEFLPFCKKLLTEFEGESKISHISGYNVLPRSKMSSPSAEIRLTRYPQSIAWATWSRAWKEFDENLNWGSNASLKEIFNVVGSWTGAVHWKLHFLDARSNRISTWAYRWIATMWSTSTRVVSPNSNLVTYVGYDEGSHTFTKPSWPELPIENMPKNFWSTVQKLPSVDEKGEIWLAKEVYRESLLGIAKHLLVIVFRTFRKESH